MTEHDATEIAYKNGYADGYAKGQLDALESTKINIRKICIEADPDTAFIFGSCGDKDFACKVPFDYGDFCKFHCGKEWINDGAVRRHA